MLGWGIILFVLIIIIVAIILKNKNEGEWYCWSDGWVISLIFSIIFATSVITIIIFAPLMIKKNINTYLETQEMVEATYNQGDETDYALNTKVIEVNQWLAGAKSNEKTFGIFSFYRGKLDDLEYIKLEEAQDE